MQSSRSNFPPVDNVSSDAPHANPQLDLGCLIRYSSIREVHVCNLLAGLFAYQNFFYENLMQLL